MTSQRFGRLGAAAALLLSGAVACACTTPATTVGPTALAQGSPTPVPGARTAAPSEASDPCPDLVGYWPGEDSAADVKGRHPGELVGGAAFAPGKLGNAFALDGLDDFVRVANAPDLNPAASFTWLAWIRPKRDGVSVIDKWGDAGEWNAQRAYDLTLPGNGSVRFGMSSEASQNIGGFHRFDSPPGLITLDAWHHVAWAYDQALGRRAIYVDGALAAERIDAPTTVAPSEADLGFGAIQRSPTLAVGFFEGLIDEVQLWDRALEATEVADAFAGEAVGGCSFAVDS